MKIKYVRDLMLLGASVVTNNENEMSEDNAKITQLWEDYTDQHIHTKTLNKVSNSSLYGVYSNYTSDDKGDYTVTVACEVSKPKNAIVIKEEKYLVFTKEGELPDIVFETWKEIWAYFETSTEHERKYTIDFEKYSSKDKIEIYISVK